MNDCLNPRELRVRQSKARMGEIGRIKKCLHHPRCIGRKAPSSMQCFGFCWGPRDFTNAMIKQPHSRLYVKAFSSLNTRRLDKLCIPDAHTYIKWDHGCQVLLYIEKVLKCMAYESMHLTDTKCICRATFNPRDYAWGCSASLATPHRLLPFSFPGSCTSTVKLRLQVYIWDEIMIREEYDCSHQGVSPSNKLAPQTASRPGFCAFIRNTSSKCS